MTTFAWRIVAIVLAIIVFLLFAGADIRKAYPDDWRLGEYFLSNKLIGGFHDRL